MNTRWINTNVSTAAEMLEVTDNLTLDMSNGEVLHPAPYEEDDPYRNSMTDYSIFGKMGNDDMLMGHIELPVPIVNIQYLFGRRPILPRLLNMDRQDLASIVYYSAYVVTSDVGYKQVILEKDAPEFQEKHSDAVLSTGAEAIAALLERDAVAEKDYIILHRLPVVPVSLRYSKVKCQKQNDAWQPFSIEYLYDRLILRKKRLIKLTDLKAPDIILLNEKRMFQEYADTLINNGAHGLPCEGTSGFPSESLQELHEMITLMPGKVHKPSMPDYEPADIEAIQEQMYILYPLTDEDDTNEPGEAACTTKDDQQEQAEKEILSLLHPFVDAVVRHNFPEYVSDYYDEMCRFAECSISSSLDTLNTDKPIEPQLLDGIVGTVRKVMKKQSMYL